MTNINFIANLHDLINQEFSSIGQSPLIGEDFNAFLIKYLNIVRRIPPIITWNIFQSKELVSKSLTPKIKSGLQKFIIKAESGQSLRSHLSKQSDNPEYKDFMFYDWAIIHFHLGTNPDPNQQKFVERTDELLFAIIDSNTAKMWLIDILPHSGAFTNQDLLRIIDDNWGDILVPHTIKGVTGLSYNPSDNDIQRLRQARINSILQTPSGRVISSIGGGITSNGTSIRIKNEADRIKMKVHHLEQIFIQQRDTFALYFKYSYRKEWNQLKFRLISFNTPLKVEEVTTGEIFEFSIYK